MTELKKKHYSKVKDGRLPPATTEAILSDLKEFEGLDVVITIEKKRKGVSKEQRGYYRAVICACFQQGAMEHWGEQLSKDEAHDNLKQACNYKEVVNEETGDVTKITLSTEKLNTFEREIYHENCRKLIYNYFGIVVPLPGEQGNLELE